MADFSYPAKLKKNTQKQRFTIVSFLLLMVFMPIIQVSAIENSDPFISEQWYLEELSAGKTSEIESDQTIVAILDAGFDLDHEDLLGNYWKNDHEIVGNEKDDDNNGFEDDTSGWDFVDSDPDPSPVIGEKINDTVASHGTLLAGIVAAVTNNGLGIVGIASNTKIMPLRIVDEFGKGTTAYARSAIKYAVENGADVINLSFTSSEPDKKLQETIEWAIDQGVVVVSALGNNNFDTDATPVYPACFDNQIGKNAIIGVASTDKKGQRASFSNYGVNCTDIVAPGVNIFGAVYNDPNNFLFSTSYGGPWEGTSMSAPMVSAAAAVLLSSYPLLTPKQVQLSLMLSADPLKDISIDERQKLGAGLLNIENALVSAKEFANTSSGIQDSKKKSSGTFVVAQGDGSDPVVKIFDAHGNEVSSFMAYSPNFQGEVRLAMGDIDGDGVEEIITGAGPGGGPHVRIFDLNGNLINHFFAFDKGGREGVNVTMGDVNGDGKEEIIVTGDEGANGQVRIFNEFGYLQSSFYPFGRTKEAVHVAVGNLDDDNANEIATTLGGGSDSSVKIFEANGRYVRSFRVLKNKVDGLNIDVGDLDRDGYDEIIVSASKGNEPWVGIYSAYGQVQQTFLAYNSNFKGGVSLGVGDIDNNGRSEIYTTPTSGGGPNLRIFEVGANLIGGFFTHNSSNRFGLTVAIR
jgi:hypothetical protein